MKSGTPTGVPLVFWRRISQHNSASVKQKGTLMGALCGGGRGIRTHVRLLSNGFQDFLTNPKLTQNNRKYQTVENAENPVKYSPRASPFSRWRVALLCHRQRLAEQSA